MKTKDWIVFLFGVISGFLLLLILGSIRIALLFKTINP